MMPLSHRYGSGLTTGCPTSSLQEQARKAYISEATFRISPDHQTINVWHITNMAYNPTIATRTNKQELANCLDRPNQARRIWNDQANRTVDGFMTHHTCPPSLKTPPCILNPTTVGTSVSLLISISYQPPS